jgi:predicted component of type VI protein secretion system
VLVTLRILDGADQGRVFADISTPVTIGREEGNSIQLNDERVSRFHVKIQDDQDKVILTDLESTNGTKVNGDEIRLRILRYGDLISIGRTLLLFGSEEQIASRLAEIRALMEPPSPTISSRGAPGNGPAASLDFELGWHESPEVRAALSARRRPELPEGLSPGQAAQLSELLEYLHARIRDLATSVKMAPREERVTLELRYWQSLLDLQAKLSDYLKRIAEPSDQ